MAPRNILFIHGMYMNGESWNPWIERADSRDFTAVAPSWPFHQGDPKFLRNHPDPALGELQFHHLVEFYKKYIDALQEQPLLVGHSVGGLIAQKLINDGYGTAAVCISPAPPQGIFSFAPEFLKANLPHLNFFAGIAPLEMTEKRFHETFCNTMNRADSDAAFERYVVPESRRVPQSILSRQGRIKFKRSHAPLFFIAGDSDNLIPLSLVNKNVRAYRKSEGKMDFRAFAKRSHFICNQPGWEEVADATFHWLDAHV